MKRKTYLKLTIALFCTTLIITSACNKGYSVDKDVFNNGSSVRNMIVVISDLHLGANLDYAEINTNLKPLENFLNKIRTSANVKELVIAGDMLDEWFVPANVDTYNGKDQTDFVQRIAKANKEVIAVFNRIIQEKKILVTYVPGNHDLTITKENVALILPGINQARDNVLGLGTYTPASFPELAIEHGHRYNFFCAPDPISNQSAAPGTIMPPGYFFTRIATTHVMQGLPSGQGVVTPITRNASGGESQNNLYEYWASWKWAVQLFTLTNKFEEKIMITNVNGLTATYSVNDLLPYQATPGGVINVNLYKGIQDTWQERQTRNLVNIIIPTEQAIVGAASDTQTDNQAKFQYFLNPKSNKRIVIFGHTHLARIEASNNYLGKKSIYANSGTWIDHSTKGPGTTFIIITPQDKKTSPETLVRLYNFENQVITEMAADSLRI